MMNDDIKKILITEDELQEKIKKLAAQINSDYDGKSLLLLGILKGSVMFMGNLMKYINVYASVDFMCVSSYGNSVTSSGDVKVLKDVDDFVKGKDVLIVEDIIDTGITLKFVREHLIKKGVNSVEIVTMLDKPSGRKEDVTAKYIGFTVGNEFVIGYGLDYAEEYRNLPYIGVLKESVYK